MLRAVTFDLWQTLILDTPEGLRKARAARVRGIEELLKDNRILVEQGTVDRAYDAVGERLEAIWGTLRDAGSETQIEILLDILGVTGRVNGDAPLVSALVEAYCLPILDALPVPNAGALKTLVALRDRGLRLALVCNTGRTPGRMLRLVLERLGLASHLTVLTFSDELGLRKPHRAIFERTLAALGVPPGDAAHVGDNLTADVAGARQVGMRAIHLCHAAGADPCAAQGETIAALTELPALLAAHP